MKIQLAMLTVFFLGPFFGLSDAQESKIKIRELDISPASLLGSSSLSPVSGVEYFAYPVFGHERPGDFLAGDLFGFQAAIQLGTFTNPVFDGVADVIGTDFAELVGNEVANPIIVDECVEVLGKDPVTGRFMLRMTIFIEATGTTEQWDTLIFDHRDPLDIDGDGITGKGPDGEYGTADDIVEPDGLVDTGDGVLDATFPLDPPIELPVLFDHDADCRNGCKNGSLVSPGIAIGCEIPILFDEASGPVDVVLAILSFVDRDGEEADLDGDGLSDGPFDVTFFPVFSDPEGWQGNFVAGLEMDENFCTTQDFAHGNVVKTQFIMTYLSNNTPSENLLCGFVLCGDANRDGAVDLLDVASFVQCISNNGILNGEFVPECDLNGDGSVDLTDVAPFIAKLAGE